MSSKLSSTSAPVWHEQSHEVVLAQLDTSAQRGLTSQEAQQRLVRFGQNRLPSAPRRSLTHLLLAQLQSPLIYLLFVSATVAFLLKEYSDALVILVVVVANAVIGAMQEGRAERSLVALQKLSELKVHVLRDGHELIVQAQELVPGDILVLAAGDAVAADARLLEGAALEVAEAALTGESVPVSKHIAPLERETVLADRKNMVYAGTHLAAGRARAVVVATGLSTEVGKVAAMTAAAEAPQTPLEKRIAEFGRWLVVASGVMFAGVVSLGLLRGLPLGDILMVGIGQVVSMVPEGLPVAITVALAVGVQRMAARGAIVRRLSAVETLGSTTVICSDKTGTLTRNEMTVTQVVLADGRALRVTGGGYAPEGRFLRDELELFPGDDAPLLTLLEAVSLCNDAELVPPDGADARWRAVGDPTEAALLTLALKGGVEHAPLVHRHPRVAELPFDAGVRMMATQHQAPEGPLVVIKGAVESVLRLCSARQVGLERLIFTDEQRGMVLEQAERLAQEALRVLAVAVVHGRRLEPETGYAPLEGQGVFVGLVGQLDPPREEVKQAVQDCLAAGIRPVMVTGDHQGTGMAIARMLGIARVGDLAVDGRALEALTDEALAEQLPRIAVFARVHPAQKLRIVEAFQRRGAVVAMTGDGVNDAPALARADVGVAMGITGTDVAKAAARVVLTDDNFATLVRAVEEGRIVYSNVRKLLLYLFSTAVAALLVLFLALLGGLPLPLAAVQILWINLATDGVVTINLIMEPPEGDELRRPPTPLDEPLLTRALMRRMLLLAPTMAFSTLGYFVWQLSTGAPFQEVQTETFTVLAVCQWFNVLNCRSEWQSIFQQNPLKNPWLVGGLIVGNVMHMGVIFIPALNDIFHTTPIALDTVLLIGLVASPVLWVEEVRKFFRRRRMAK